MSDRWTDILSDYIDDELELARREELEAHLRECADCTATLADLRLVTDRARALPEGGADPVPNLWPGIMARISHGTGTVPIRRISSWSERRVSFSMTQLAAACLVAAVLSGSAVWYARTSARREAGQLISGPSSTGVLASTPSASEPPTTSVAVEELRRALASGREDLDPTTVRTLEESLTIIDIAIQQARRALDADPRNPYVRAHLDETMRRKVELLHRATMLASAPQ